jgi:hypothetical protein
VGHAAYMGKIVIRTFQGKIQHGRPKHKWENNISIGFRKTGFGFSHIRIGAIGRFLCSQ